MAEIVIGGAEALLERPAVFCNINVNSPLHYDVRMLEGLLAYADAGQPVIVTPFLLMGAMAPVTVPAALVQQTAEVLAGLALVQLVRPGAPCVMGSFLSATDMKSGAPSFGGPESAFGLYASGQIARRLGPALAIGRRHADRQPDGRLPGRLRGLQHAQRRLPGGRERVLAVGRAGWRAAWSPASRSSSPTSS